MKKVTFIVLLSLLSFNMAIAGVISGRVIDAKTKEPLEYVTVVVRKKNVENAVAGTLTDKSGTFIINNIPPDNYIVTVSFVGYSTWEQDVVVETGAQKINLKQIAIDEESEMLKEVEITGMKSQMKIDIDKKVFNVDQNIASTGGNASDVLNNIPSVEVDNEGSVSLRGNSAVTVWINGKASGLSSDNRGQILEQLPAENIEKIEVITNPSAKYSPEGTAGIINIILKENRRAGYFGNIQAGVDTRGGYNGSFNINYGNRKIDAEASVGYRRRAFVNGGYSNRQNYGLDTTFLNQTSEGDGYRQNLFTRLGLTYHLTTSDHLNINGFGMFGGGNTSSSINYQSNMPLSYLTSRRLSNTEGNMLGANVEIGYKHDFSKTSNIDFTASYNKWGMDNTTDYTQTSHFASGVVNTYQMQKQKIDPHNWDMQLDYVNAFNENSKIEAGYKASLRRENSPVETFAGQNKNNAQAVHELYNRFIYNQDIHALYSTYSGRIGKFGYQGGLRAEYTDRLTRSLGHNMTEAEVDADKNSYLDFFPSVFLSYALPKDNEMQVNYTRRISRPWGGQLNSFKNITDSTNISFGNPLLTPEYSNAFELNYIKSMNNHILSLSAYYRTTDDVIQRISYIDQDIIMKSTHRNIAHTESAGTELIVKNKLFSKLDLTTTLNLFYYKLDDFRYQPEDANVPVVGRGQEDFSWNAKIIANFMIPKVFTLQVTGDYSARQYTTQGYRKPNYSIDAGIRKSFNKLSVSISARDILASRKRRSVTSGIGFYQDAENWRGGRQVALTITYGFGNMRAKKPDVKKRQQEQQGSGYEDDL
ncbi:MAG: TonB-dependent receptor family protein [Prevotellaceae bacterium]|jgi:outer membrane receptor protein involved in Fe transport|nr:TonB-dependent receptor family protein [Prevotellaceae bacterium]